MGPNGFERLHPAVTFGFFAGAVVLAVLGNYPAFQVVGLLAAAATYFTMKGREGLPFLGGLLLLAIVLTLVNPFFVPQGNTVLFTYFAGCPYTLEGLVYGASTAVMLATVLLWFGCFNQVMTSEKLTYLFGKAAPAVTIVITMVLRMVPLYRLKARSISDTRGALGLSVREGSAIQRVRSGARDLSALTTWGLESAVTTADSMRARGFGTGRRTFFARYRFAGESAAVAVFLALTFLGALTGILSLGTMIFLPTVQLPLLDLRAAVGLVAYGLFLCTPLLLMGKEVLQWRCSLSKL